MAVVVEQFLEECAPVYREVVVYRLLPVLDGHVVEFDVVDCIRNLCLEALLVRAEKLPDVCVGERVLVALRLFEAATAVRAEVLAFHVLEPARDLLVALVLEHLLHELFAVGVVFLDKFRVAFFCREQFLHLEGHQAARHVQKVARLREVGHPNLVDPCEEVVRDFCNRDLVQRHFLLLDKVYEQVHGPVERTYADFVVFLFLDFGHYSRNVVII